MHALFARMLMLAAVVLAAAPAFAVPVSPQHADSVRPRRGELLRMRQEQAYSRIDSLRAAAHERAMQKSAHARKIDSLFNAADERARRSVDTLYIRKPSEMWTVKLRTNLSGNDMLLRGKYLNERRRIDLRAAHKLTLTLGVGYRGINLSLAANPLKWAGKNMDFEYNLNSYGNRFGFDVIYTAANTFRGHGWVGGERYDIDPGDVRQRMFTGNVYYAFNYRRFSYPAAFSQSRIQLRSAGSWLLSAMFLGGTLRSDGSQEAQVPATKLRSWSLGIGGGYAYNLVLPHSWMLHASLTPEIVVYNHSNLRVDGEKSKAPYRFPNFMTVGRAAVVHNWQHYFFAVGGVYNYGDTGDYDTMRMFQMKWRVRLALGMRI